MRAEGKLSPSRKEVNDNQDKKVYICIGVRQDSTHRKGSSVAFKRDRPARGVFYIKAISRGRRGKFFKRVHFFHIRSKGEGLKKIRGGLGCKKTWRSKFLQARKEKRRRESKGKTARLDIVRKPQLYDLFPLTI